MQPEYILGGIIGALQGAILLLINMQNKKIDSFCKDNREEHEDLYNHKNEHEHRITVVETKVGIKSEKSWQG
jgi:hypothetical protein